MTTIDKPPFIHRYVSDSKMVLVLKTLLMLVAILIAIYLITSNVTV